MAEVFNFNMFQIPQTGVGGETKGNSVQTRDLDLKISNFGALKNGGRSGTDYTMVLNNFKDKDELLNPVIPAFLQDGEYEENPLVWGSTVKYTRDDQLMRMGNTTTIGSYIGMPKFDVSDTNVANMDVSVGNNAIKNWPTEGWRSYGGKYDFSEAYQGS